jgi:hypothetical protein
LRKSVLRLRGSPVDGANPQPFFRDTVPDLPVAQGDGFPERARASFGRETAFRILPYTRQDRYSRVLQDMALPSIVMENDALRAEFVPALGGRLMSLFDKKEGRDILYRNPVLRPANLAIRDAWFSGGIEWNIGRLGHSVHTCSPVFAGTFVDRKAGEETVLRLWEFERQTRLFWRLECVLPDDSDALYVYVRIENPDREKKPLYWWTNAALPQTMGMSPGNFPGARVLSATDEALYIVPGTGPVKTMDGGRLPKLPVLPGVDASYPMVSDYANEYFFQNRGPFPWESVVYEDGYAYAEASTAPLLYRKMFCWGTGRGGRRWQEFLSLPGEQYLEVQAGLAPTQLHTADIDGGAVVDWMQAFTALRVDPKQAHRGDYRAASGYVEGIVKEAIPPASLEDALQTARLRSGVNAAILSLGSGWGALERQRVERGPSPADGGFRDGIPDGLSFPDASIGEEERPWAMLLSTGCLPPRPVEAGPGSFVTDAMWEPLLLQSRANADTERHDWLTPYHLGVIAFERGETERAEGYWNASIAAQENAWSYRNLAVAALRRAASGDGIEAVSWYKKAFDRKEGRLDPSFAEEYIPFLIEQGRVEEAAAALAAYGLGDADLQGPLLDAAARIAFAQKDDIRLDKIFSREPALIREGNTTLVDLWTAREIRRLTDRGVDPAAAEARVRKALASGKLVPPREIDFRMYTRPAH